MSTGRMGRNPFGQKKATPQPEPAPTIREEPEQIDEAPQGVLAKAFIKAAVEIPADLFVLGLKTRAFFESWLE